MRLALIPILAALVLAAGCGGGGDDESESPAQAWSDDFCSAAADWRASLDDVISGLSPSDLSEDGIRGAVDEGLDATESFLADVRGLGAPDTEAGQEVEAIVDDMAASVQSTVDDLRASVDEAESLPDLLGTVTEAGAQIGGLENELQSSLDELESVDTGELREELEANGDCDAARSGS
jgi:hypothetical protein